MSIITIIGEFLKKWNKFDEDGAGRLRREILELKEKVKNIQNGPATKGRVKKILYFQKK
jgi:hypothetical protein